MADKKISQLTNLTGANLAENDEFVLVDTSADETKAITFGELKTAFDTGTGFVRVTGDTMTGDLSFDGGDTIYGDNDKAIFGAGSDLQIYHTGGQSVIEDAGQGNLVILATDFYLNNSANTENMITALNDGSVGLFYNNSKKLATTSTGVDITGTLTSDGLTVESNNNSTGAVATLSNTNTSTDGNTALGSLVFESNDDSAGATNAEIKSMSAGTGGQAELFLRTGSAGTLYDRIKVSYIGDISFYEDTGTTPKFFWNASEESLSLGDTLVTALQTPLRVKSNSSDYGICIEENSGGETWQIGVDADGDLGFYNSGAATASVTFDDSGNVGIGTSSPQRNLQVGEYGTGSSTIAIASATNGYGYVVFGDSVAGDGVYRGAITYAHSNDAMLFNTAASEAMRIDSSGNVGIGTSSPASYGQLTLYKNGANDTKLALANNGNGGGTVAWTLKHDTAWDLTLSHNAGIGGQNLIFGTKTSGSESMRIDSSGNLLVGKTSASFSTAGHELRAGAAAIFVRDGNDCLSLNRLTSDGDIAKFSKDGSTVGSIGVNSSDNLRIAGTAASHSGIEFSTNQILPLSANVFSDASQNIGSSSFRFKDLYLSGGVYLGGAGSANHLDDYEEGTWTPTVPVGTPTLYGTATYIKIGKMVFIAADVQMPNQTDSNQARIAGLPFTPYLRGTNSEYNLSPGEHTFGSYITLSLHSSYPAIVFRPSGGNSVDYTTVSADRFRFSGWYEAV